MRAMLDHVIRVLQLMAVAVAVGVGASESCSYRRVASHTRNHGREEPLVPRTCRFGRAP